MMMVSTEGHHDERMDGKRGEEKGACQLVPKEEIQTLPVKSPEVGHLSTHRLMEGWQVESLVWVSVGPGSTR